ncbi:MAG: energy-coupling factor transporter transmembrane protein EcfT [Ruminococcus flavefaciens]|nr:energy-coupling factor transporter transmembrane protein EcfT [Ruminococcus flavefaciens]
MELGLSSTSDKSVLKLDPRTKLCLLIAISLIMVGGKTVGVEYILRVICAAIPFVLLLTVRHIKSALIYVVLIAFSVFCEGSVIPNISGAPNLILMILCGIISRFVPGYMMGWYTVRSTSVSEFMTAMDRMHVPYFITIPFSVMFRYFPTLSEEYRSVHDAMKMREIGQSVKNPFTYIEYVLVPIMMSTVRIADELSAASLTKGLCAGGKRTHICQISIRLYDWLLMFGTLAMIVLFFAF